MFRKSLFIIFVLAIAMCFGCTEKDCNNCDSGEVQLDVDSDGILDSLDNCPDDSNPDQADADDDGAGDECDNCPVSNPGQENADGDDLGDVCDDCPLDADNDADGDGKCGDEDNCPNLSNPDQADTDLDDMGNVCDPCPDDPLNACTSGPALIPAALLVVSSGCVPYEGDHPVEPGQGFVVHYEFCADGTAVKDWNPSPVESPGLPGDTHGVGNWSYVGNELNITTTATTVIGPMVTVEEYGVAFTYDSGAKLDWYSVAQTAPGNGSTIIGSYASQGKASVTAGALLDFDADITKEMDVTDGDPASWAQTETQVKTCIGDLACTPDMRGTSNIDTNGTIAMPGQLYQVGSGYILQVDDTLILERQE